ncbi:MAG: Fic family protein [Spirochaetota bacterium]
MKSKTFDPETPYNSLPLLPPKEDLETKAVLKQLVRAKQNLAELKGYASQLPSRELIVNSIVLQEAKDSSEIENIVTTTDELYQALALPSSKIDSRVKEVLDYRAALWEGFDLVRKKNLITVNTIIAIQQRLEGNRAGLRKLPGTVLANERSGSVMYTPPDNNDDIVRLMNNLEHYINNTDSLDPLVRMALIHYQFEAIHPFYDGNGRTGRIINVLYLVIQDLIETPYLYLSRYIIKNKSDYYTLLREVTVNNSWEPWILYMLSAVEHTAKETLVLSKAIIASMEETGNTMKTKLPGVYSREFLELLYSNVYVRIGAVVDSGIASRNIASAYLKKCEQAGILTSRQSGRDTFYINTKLYELLKGF